ncbi:MAG: hypothetical protein EAZ47_11120 [Bacteroidetes bacterium]|nr:MAG: hypothetical protein EAZ47_11120 [Bacteroidota bacterium]
MRFKPLYHLIFYIITGTIVSILQVFVLSGFPLSFQDDFWGEILFACLYIFCLTQLQKRILTSSVSQFKRNTFSIEIFSKYFLLIQLGGLGILFLNGFLLEFIVTGKLNFKLRTFSQLRFILVYYFFINAIIYCIGIGFRLYKLYGKEKDAKHLAEKSFMAAQLQMLRQQLNPHFLFNNLNIIASTIHNNPTIAYDFTKSMAAFYRKVLEAENAGWIPLKEELKTIQYYLHMLAVRFEDKLAFSIDISEENKNNFSLPDFILQPIVENAIKHNECSRNKPLTINIYVADNGNLVIRNIFQPKLETDQNIGIGWFNIENRYKYLAAQAPIKYIKDGWFYVEVWLLPNNQ